MNIIEFIKKTFDHNSFPEYVSVSHMLATGFSLVMFCVLCIALGVHLVDDFITWTTPAINWPVAGRWFILSTTYPVLSYYWLRNKI